MGILLVGIAIGAVIFLGTLWTVRLIEFGPPPEPDPDAVRDVDISYRCSVCGMQLTVTQAQDAEVDPPRHCREEMVPL